MGVLLALCLGGPWLLTGRARSGMLLFGCSALALLLFPILLKAYDYRFTIAAFGPLVTGGALAAWGFVVTVKAKPLAARPFGRVVRHHDGLGSEPHRDRTDLATGHTFASGAWPQLRSSGAPTPRRRERGVEI